jgi:hypothetical protein
MTHCRSSHFHHVLRRSNQQIRMIYSSRLPPGRHIVQGRGIPPGHPRKHAGESHPPPPHVRTTRRIARPTYPIMAIHRPKLSFRSVRSDNHALHSSPRIPRPWTARIRTNPFAPPCLPFLLLRPIIPKACRTNSGAEHPKECASQFPLCSRFMPPAEFHPIYCHSLKLLLYPLNLSLRILNDTYHNGLPLSISIQAKKNLLCVQSLPAE